MIDATRVGTIIDQCPADLGIGATRARLCLARVSLPLCLGSLPHSGFRGIDHVRSPQAEPVRKGRFGDG